DAVPLLRRQLAGRPLELHGDVLDADQLMDLDAGAAALVGVGGGDEAVVQVVALGGGLLLDAVAGAVVVGEEQPARRDEGAGAAVAQTHRGALHALAPGVGGGEAVLGLETLARQVGERPHPFIGVHRSGGQAGGAEHSDAEQPQAGSWYGLHGVLLSPRYPSA